MTYLIKISYIISNLDICNNCLKIITYTINATIFWQVIAVTKISNWIVKYMNSIQCNFSFHINGVSCHIWLKSPFYNVIRENAVCNFRLSHASKRPKNRLQMNRKDTCDALIKLFKNIIQWTVLAILQELARIHCVIIKSAHNAWVIKYFFYLCYYLYAFDQSTFF